MARGCRSLLRVASACLLASSGARALEVITPSEGLVVVADRTYTVEWTGSPSDQRFEIDLYYCGSYCVDDDCGEWVTALCPYGETGCPDNEGDYDIVMPEPLSGTSGSGYKVRVMDAESSDSDADCSDEFYLMASVEAPTTDSPDGPYLIVTSPSDGDFAEAGDEYTVEWDYNNGVGSRVDRFKIDLYIAEGTGDCGTWLTNLCDKESIGCKDSMGDYDVEIPESVPDGEYRIRVGRFEDDFLFSCSGTFVVSETAPGSGSGSGSGAGGSASSTSGSGSNSASSAVGGTSGEGYGSGSGSASSVSASSGSGSGSGDGSGEGSGSGSGAGGGSTSSGVGEGSGADSSGSGSGSGDGSGEGSQSGSGADGDSASSSGVGEGSGADSNGSASSGSGSGSGNGSGEESQSGSGADGDSASSSSGEASDDDGEDKDDDSVSRDNSEDGDSGDSDSAGSDSGDDDSGNADGSSEDDGQGDGDGYDDDEWLYSYSYSYSYSSEEFADMLE